ncbi:hypothetical protein LEMLEM_LOCUS10605 [Lemmus lemmus]
MKKKLCSSLAKKLSAWVCVTVGRCQRLWHRYR